MYQCDSPNLIKCFDVYRNEDLKVMAIEYCNGKTLQAEIDEKRRIPEAEAVMIAKHVIIGMMVALRLFRNCIATTSSTGISRQKISCRTTAPTRSSTLDSPRSYKSRRKTQKSRAPPWAPSPRWLRR